MTDITFRRKKKLNKSSTLSMHVDGVLLAKFRNKCVDEFGMVHTDLIRNFIEDVVNGNIKINVKE